MKLCSGAGIALSESPSDDGRPVGDATPSGEPPSALSDLRRRAPTGDHRAVDELMQWARRRAEEILASLSPDSELLELLRTDDPPPTSPLPRARSGGTRRGMPIPAPAPAPAARATPPRPSPTRKATLLSHAPRPSAERDDVILDALPPAASDAEDQGGVSALAASPVAHVLPRLQTTAAAPPARRHPRYDLDAPVTIRYDEWSDLVELCTRDISKGGMFVKTSSPPPLRSKITVQLRLPQDTGVLELSGEVVHVMGGGEGGPVLGFGLQFDELGDRRRAMLDRLVDHAREMAERPGVEGVTLTELGLGTPAAGGPSLRLTLTPEELARMNDLRAELASLDAKDDLALLGLSGAPTLARIDAAFESLEARWHPGRWSTRAAAEVETLAMDVFRRIEAAYMRVSAEVRRRDVPPPPPFAKTSVASPPPPMVTTPAAPPAAPPAAAGPPRLSSLEFNKLVGRGFEQLSRKQYRAAIASFSQAVAQRPESTKAQILLRFAEARLFVAERKLPEARKKYEEVLELDPDNATAKRDLVMLACLD
jgi:tetratricopeptide (TPR) repeat protein